MNQPIACIILRGSIDDWYVFPLLLAFIAFSVAARYWRFFAQWLDGIRGRDWASISAVIDVVSVIAQKENGRYGEYVVGYLATLTYFYRNPELQMGEYSRMFDSNDEEEAKAWAASYKGRTVLVQVDPHDLTHSVLRKEEL
jgi:hypothetical protein